MLGIHTTAQQVSVCTRLRHKAGLWSAGQARFATSFRTTETARRKPEQVTVMHITPLMICMYHTQAATSVCMTVPADRAAAQGT